MPSGIIIKGIGGFYYVISDEAVYECKARGIFRRNDMAPLPGDRVGFTIIDEDKNIGNIDEIYPRQSKLLRPAVANVNQVAVVIAVNSPAPDFLLLDKLLITAEKENLNAIICINKIDLDVDEEYKKIVETYSNTGYRLILMSLKANRGLNELKEALHGKVTVLAGQSGVGKSTILNSIMDTLVMKTGILSEKTVRGKHTTRHAELILLADGGYIVDTPGFSSFELAEIDHNELQTFYPEFDSIADNCRFTGCSHISEPECRVKEVLESGSINADRYSRYVELYSNLKQNNDMKYKKSNREKEKR